MNRSERHREIKSISKELTFIQKHTVLPQLLKDKSLNIIDEANRLLLVAGTHEDKVLQEKWNKLTTLFQRSYSLEARLQYLKVGYKFEQNIPIIEK
jgi:hypothetical protein